MLTATAGVITAVTGLVIALDQVGLLGGAERAPGGESVMDSAIVLQGPVDPVRSAAPATAAGSAAAPRFEPAMAEVTAGEIRYQILGISSRLRNPGSYSLRLQVRMHNDGAYGANFWDDTFRLVIDGVPRAPISGLNEIVDGRSAEDGEVEFVVPTSAQSLVLRVHRADETLEVPLQRVNP